MLKIESLTRRYPHVTALDGLNMEIGHGQCVVRNSVRSERLSDHVSENGRCRAADE